MIDLGKGLFDMASGMVRFQTGLLLPAPRPQVDNPEMRAFEDGYRMGQRDARDEAQQPDEPWPGAYAEGDNDTD